MGQWSLTSSACGDIGKEICYLLITSGEKELKKKKDEYNLQDIWVKLCICSGMDEGRDTRIEKFNPRQGVERFLIENRNLAFVLA